MKDKLENKIALVLSTLDQMFEKIRDVNLHKKLKKIRRQEVRLELSINAQLLGSTELKKIAETIKFCTKNKYFKIHFKLNLKNVEVFADKITYLFLDMMIFYFLNKCKTSDLDLEYFFDASNYNNTALCTTAFGRYNEQYPNQLLSASEYNKLFLKEKETKYYGDLLFYRFFYTKYDYSPDLISKIATEIHSVLNRCFDESWVNDICRAIEEVIDNAIAHNEEMFLLDLHYSLSLLKTDSDDKNEYNGVYLGIINLGSQNLYSQLKYNVQEKIYDSNDPVYKNVYLAYDKHSPYMQKEGYNENLFFMVTSFQEKVTSRYDKSGNSGIGLTTLIKKVSGGRSYQHCYVLSGNNVILFQDEFLKISEKGFIGFNKENDYVNNIPDKSILSNSDIYCPGTVYHFNLIDKRV